MMMDEGVEYGYHGHNGSPVQINPGPRNRPQRTRRRDARRRKTFGDIMRHLRMMMKRQQDTMLVMIDPVGGFKGIADALNAKTISVGATHS